ncbi:hypothetical protein PRUB_a3448 [Pseudoalteromonas rubra]|uniref:Uncharacterized protein n=2 Tax=Pseudoalteromonas TaxID=53246 RepID=A0A8T0C319_9GAMM|nr:hypothetical protein PRUB_a3448 [Pseudoalteromonas rubra]
MSWNYQPDILPTSFTNGLLGIIRGYRHTGFKFGNLMKKLSKVQQKQQALVLTVADAIEEQARAEIPGMVQCWFDVEYHLFPGSLLLCFQFEDQATLDAAKPDLLKWQKRLSAAMLKKGVILKDMRKHLTFTLEGPED